MQHTMNAVTRFGDLDTQRHVTSRTYELFALEARYSVLRDLGFSQERIQNEQIYLEAVRGYSKFHRQQFPGSELRVETQVSSLGGALLHWDQRILEKSGALVCHLQLETRLTQAKNPIEVQGVEKQDSLEALYSDLAPWSGKGQRITSRYTMPFSDRDFAGRYNVASLWRIFEEGRWNFAAQTGLTYEKIIAMDTTSFYMGSVANYFEEIPAGETVDIVTWIERIEKIRYFFRQDIVLNGKIMLSMRDEQLIVSVSKQRPQRASSFFLEYVAPYLEHG